MRNNNEQQPNITELINTTMQTDTYQFDDYEIILRRAIAMLVSSPRFAGDINTDDAFQILNLYHLLWQLKPYFKQQ